MKRLFVTGATGQIGDFLLPMLVQAGYELHALSRNGRPAANGVVWHKGDDAGGSRPAEYDALIHLAYLPRLPTLLRGAPPSLTRVIAFGSTSRFTKQDSPNGHEFKVASDLAHAEQEISALCAARGIGWTLFRPTLIYGAGRDGNVTTIMRLLRRFPLFPLIGGGQALRQPVHAQDLADAVLRALEAPATHNRAYNLSGGETLSYRDMVARIAQKLGRRPRFVGVPLPLLRLAVACIRQLPGYRHLSMEMATRMQENLCFSHQDAVRDFGYSPGPFRP